MNETPKGLKRIAIEPVSRVEGHGKITLLLDDDNKVHQARLHITEFRGFEKFIQGRPYWELPVLVQRLCGICPVSHHLAAGKAIDMIHGHPRLTPATTKLRHLLHWGQVLQSHALHFFMLAAPDLLFGYQSDVAKRNIVGIIERHPDIALQGIKIRKYGQQVIEAITGKRIHGIACVPGGMNQPLSKAAVKTLQTDIADVVDWTQQAVELAKSLCLNDRPLFDSFAHFSSPSLSLTTPQGDFELYDGDIRVKAANGRLLTDQFPCDRYFDLIHEEAKSWSYMKFPYLADIREQSSTDDSGWYRVGPLARVNNCDRFTTPMAESYRQDYLAIAGSPLCQQSLGFHWARMIEALHCAEAIQQVLADPDLLSHDLLAGDPNDRSKRQAEGIGVIEAPRGTLFHHYQVDDEDRVSMANLIVSTTSNNWAMNTAVQQVAAEHLDGEKITEGLLNMLEVAVRAYDPCLSCATHAVGQMPLDVELIAADGRQLHKVSKSSQGEIVEW